MKNTISLELLSTVTGGLNLFTIPETGGIVGPKGSPTPNWDKAMSHADELRRGNGGIVPKIPELGGIVGPKGSPTPRF